MRSEFDFTGKGMIVTGGTKGIGKSIADVFYQHGADVGIIGRDSGHGTDAVKEIQNNRPDHTNRCVFYQCDVSNHDEVKEVCSRILHDFQTIDVLTLNAGIEVKASKLDETEIEDWDKLMGVNVNGAFYFIKYLSNVMEAQGRGNIIFISSVSSVTGGGTGIHYPTSKAALQGMMARINYEMLEKGVRANMISPGLVDTPLLRSKYPDTEETNASLDSQVPMGRIGTPEDIAGIALFLASDLSSYVCGQNITADGGRLAYKKSVVKR